jgi:hypothetical protein
MVSPPSWWTGTYYQVGKTRRAFWDNSSAGNTHKDPTRPIQKKEKKGRYLFEYELRMILGVFSTCWAKNYERSEGWIYKR